MNLCDVFADELRGFSDVRIKELVEDVLRALELANGYFMVAPASDSKKYHPACCNVRCGLLRHVKRAVGIGTHLCTAYGMSRRDTDVVVAALILHDIWKNDFRSHASRAGDFVMQVIGRNQAKYASIGADTLVQIVKAIRYHMGLWTEPAFKKPISDYNLIELVVYTADYLSSRPDIGMGQATCALPTDFPGEDLIKGAA